MSEKENVGGGKKGEGEGGEERGNGRRKEFHFPNGNQSGMDDKKKKMDQIKKSDK